MDENNEKIKSEIISYTYQNTLLLSQKPAKT